jgi:hypothetical protein
LLASIIKFLSIPCRRLLAGDGITTVDFTVNEAKGVIGELSIDARAAKKSSPPMGYAFGIAKNLDEYQYRICMLVPSLADSNPAKIQLQKYRVAIIASFAALVTAIKSGDVAEWNGHARALLVDASDLYLAATSGQDVPAPRAHAAFAFFGVPEQQAEGALRSMYGY